MKLLLLPLLAAIALPTAVNAESYWLIITYGDAESNHRSVALEKMEMASLEACKKEGRRWENSPTHGKIDKNESSEDFIVL